MDPKIRSNCWCTGQTPASIDPADAANQAVDPKQRARSWHRRGRAIEAGADSARGAVRDADTRERAEDAYRRALGWDPTYAAAHADLGRLRHERGALGDAERHYRAAIALAPREATYWYNLGVVLQDQQHLGGALLAYGAALARDPCCADAHFNIASVLERSGNHRGVIRHLAAYRRLSRSPRE